MGIRILPAVLNGPIRPLLRVGLADAVEKRQLLLLKVLPRV
jgi:hypothetical protein